MTLHAPASGGFEPAPAGAHAAVLTRVVDLGSQTTSFGGREKTTRAVLFSWELAETDKTGARFFVSQRYTLSMHRKAKLRAHVESWRGAPFNNDAEAEAFDFATLLGKSCLLTLVQVQRADRTFSNVSAIAPLPKVMHAPKLQGATYHFSFDDAFDAAAFAELSDGLKNLIALSPEYAAATAPMAAPHRAEPVDKRGRSRGGRR